MIISRLLKTRWAARAGWLGVVVALLLVTHPELRALLLLADAVGLELLVFLVATQVRAGLPGWRYGLGLLGRALQPAWRLAGRLLQAVMAGGVVLLLPRELMRSAAAQLAWLGRVSVRASLR